MWLPSKYLVFLLLFLYYAEATTTTTTKSISGGVNKRTNFRCLPGGGGQDDWTYINNIGGSLYTANILKSGDLLDIFAVVSQHEGTYNCTANGKTSHNILTVLAVPKFDAQGCSPLSHCDLGTTATIPEGQPLPINITMDYVNGGAKGEKQSIEFSRIKQKDSGNNNLVICNQNNCQRDDNVLPSPRIQTDPWSIQANITDNRPLNVSRVYLVEIDVSEGSNVYTTITATFTIRVTPTSSAVSSTLTQDIMTSSDFVLTSITFVMASLSSSSLLTSSLATVPVSIITSPTNTVSSHSPSGGTSSGLTSTPSPSPSSSSPSSSSPPFLSSLPFSSSSSHPPTATGSAVSSNLMQDIMASSDFVLTSTTFVMASLSLSSLLTSSLTTVPVSIITSTTNTVSFHTPSGGTSSGLTSTPSPSSPSSPSSSPPSLSSSPSSSSSSHLPIVTVFFVCKAKTTDGDRGLFEWPETAANSTANVSCPNNPNGAIAMRRCSKLGIWESPNLASCPTTIAYTEFRNISKVNVTIDNVVAVSYNLSDLVMSTTDTADQNIDNIIVVSTILKQTASLLSNSTILSTLSLKEVIMMTENTVQILDDIEEWPPTVVETESNEILKSFEKAVDALLSQGNFTNVTIIDDDIAFKGEQIKQSFFRGIEFTASFLNDSLALETHQGGSVEKELLASASLSQSILSVISSDDVTVAFTLYKQAVLFPVRGSSPSTIIGSPVVGIKLDGVPDGTKLPDPVIVNLSLVNITNITDPLCVFWDFTAADGNGNWSTDGCLTVVAHNLSSVTCKCDHLTNFACLIDVSARTEDATKASRSATITLEVVSYIGVCLSLLGLVITIVTLTIFKKIRAKDASKFHIQLCLSLSFMLIVFVTGIDRVSVRAGCITVGVLIHYFALVSWMWMGAEAILMFQKIIIVFSTITWKYLLVVSFTCWTLPLLPVTVTFAVDHDFYIYLYKDESQSGFCFISHIVPFFISFLLFVFLILIFNIVIYVLIIGAIIRHILLKNKRKSKSSLTVSVAVKMLVFYSGIMVLFGLTWLFAIFAFITEPNVSFVVQFFFAVFNTLQGFLIFLFFVLLNGDSRNAWKSVLCLWTKRSKKLKITRTSASSTKSNNFNSVSLKSKVPLHDCDTYSEKKKGITSKSTDM